MRNRFHYSFWILISLFVHDIFRWYASSALQATKIAGSFLHKDNTGRAFDYSRTKKARTTSVPEQTTHCVKTARESVLIRKTPVIYRYSSPLGRNSTTASFVKAFKDSVVQFPEMKVRPEQGSRQIIFKFRRLPRRSPRRLAYRFDRNCPDAPNEILRV